MNFVKINFFKKIIKNKLIKIIFFCLFLLIFLSFNLFKIVNIYAFSDSDKEKSSESNYEKQRKTCETEVKQHKRLYEHFYDKQTVKQKIKSILKKFVGKEAKLIELIENILQKNSVIENIFTKNEEKIDFLGEEIKIHLLEYLMQQYCKSEISEILKLEHDNFYEKNEQIVERLSEKYFAYVCYKIFEFDIEKKYFLEDYEKTKTKDDKGNEIEISVRDENNEGENLKRTQLFSYEPYSANLQFQIEFSNVFYKILKEFLYEIKNNIYLKSNEIEKYKNRIIKELNIEDKIEQMIDNEIINNDSEFKKESEKDFKKKVSKLFDLNQYFDLNMLISNNLLNFVDIESFFSSCDIGESNNKEGSWQNKKDLISFITNEKIKDLIIENLKKYYIIQNSYANKQNKNIDFFKINQIKKLYAQLVFQISCFEDTIQCKSKIQELDDFIKEKLNNMNSDYLKKIDEKKEKFKKYIDFLNLELKTQERDLDKRYDKKSLDIIYLQEAKDLKTKLNDNINELQKFFELKNILQPNKQILDNYDEIEYFINKNKSYSSKSDFQQFVKDYYFKIFKNNQDYIRIKDEIQNELEEIKEEKEQILEQINKNDFLKKIFFENKFSDTKYFIPYDLQEECSLINDEFKYLINEINGIQIENLSNSYYYETVINEFLHKHNEKNKFEEKDFFKTLNEEISIFENEQNKSFKILEKKFSDIDKNIKESFSKLQNQPNDQQMLQMITNNKTFFDDLKKNLNNFQIEIEKNIESLKKDQMEFIKKINIKHDLLKQKNSQFLQKQKNFFIQEKEALKIKIEEQRNLEIKNSFCVDDITKQITNKKDPQKLKTSLENLKTNLKDLKLKSSDSELKLNTFFEDYKKQNFQTIIKNESYSIDLNRKLNKLRVCCYEKV